MNQITKVFESSEVRIVEIKGNPWFVAKDVSNILGFRDPYAATRGLDEDDKLLHTLCVGGQNRETTIINESGLYSLVLKSNKPEAKVFKRWVTNEVLPSIRKTGGYVANDELFIQTYLPFADDSTKLMFSATLETVRKQNEVIAVMRPKAEQHDRFISGENYQTLEQAGKSVGLGRNKLSALLKAIEVFTQKGASPVPYQQYINSGYFVVKQTPSNYGDFNNVQTYVTAKGVSYIDSLLDKYGGTRKLNAMKLSEIRRIQRK
ncbi:phage antirepressor KilAC domain-containing protein [Cytobacillus solani]|uniref:phage antirepressor KilAC domain-containing protein n=1 Tax=Cytobacillus solani TaxID=1637975 RepID=UPI00094965C4|nr:phage antirepressor KilAC domain-containing protein [Cytobacillus solani]